MHKTTGSFVIILFKNILSFVCNSKNQGYSCDSFFSLFFLSQIKHRSKYTKNKIKQKASALIEVRVMLFYFYLFIFGACERDMRTRLATSSGSGSGSGRVTVGHRHAWKADTVRGVRRSGDVGDRGAARTEERWSENAAATPAHRLS